MRASRVGFIALCAFFCALCVVIAASAVYDLVTRPFDPADVGYLLTNSALAILFGHWLREELRPRRRFSEPELDEPASIGGQRYQESEDQDV